MSKALLLSALWVVAATVVAMLPLRLQYVPGLLLLAAAPVLVGMLGFEYGWLVALAGLAAVLSMFRRPLRHLWRRRRGIRTEAEDTP